MLFWIAALAMLVAAVFCLLLPMARTKDAAVSAPAASDVYRQQLIDIEDENPTSTAEKEALEARRAEIARRLLKEEAQASKVPVSSEGRSKLGVALGLVSALLVLPGVSLSTYLLLGSPGQPDFPLSARATDRLEDKSLEEMVQIAEKHLAKNPDDIRGWRVLADVYGRISQPSDRARALEQIIRISGSTPALMVELGEALTVAEGNIVKDRARRLFEEALAANPRLIKASVYLALATEQEGRFADALVAWQTLSRERPDDAQWQEMAASRIAALQQRVGAAVNPDGSQSADLAGPTREDVENAAALSTDDRQAMIENMVQQLADKLAEDPDNLEGWQRLLRSYVVLNKRDKAAEALVAALDHFVSAPEQQARLRAFATDLGLEQPAAAGADAASSPENGDGEKK